MLKAIAVAAAGTTFLVCLAAIREHAALIRTGYELSARECAREVLVTERARMRERVSHLSSPPVLAERARKLGLTGEYPEEYGVVRMGIRIRREGFFVRNE